MDTPVLGVPPDRPCDRNRVPLRKGMLPDAGERPRTRDWGTPPNVD